MKVSTFITFFLYIIIPLNKINLIVAERIKVKLKQHFKPYLNIHWQHFKPYYNHYNVMKNNEIIGQQLFINARESNKISLLIFISYETEKFLECEMSRKTVFNFNLL